jgi:hypothetical protein
VFGTLRKAEEALALTGIMQTVLLIVAQAVPLTNAATGTPVDPSHSVGTALGHVLMLAVMVAMGAAVIAAMVKPPFQQ